MENFRYKFNSVHSVDIISRIMCDIHSFSTDIYYKTWIATVREDDLD